MSECAHAVERPIPAPAHNPFSLLASLACCSAPACLPHPHLAGLPHPHRCSPQLVLPALTDLLLGAFGERLGARLRRVPQLLATREGNPAVSSFQLPGCGSFVESIAAHFKAQGLARPTLQLLHALRKMDEHFMQPDTAKWTESVQLLRLVAAPGMGKVREGWGTWCV